MITFLMKFALTFRGPCGSKYRGHEYSLSIQDICKRDFKDNKWIHADDAKDDYYYFHRKSPIRVRPSCYGKSKWGEGIKKLREAWKSKKFYTESFINPSSCEPILKIKLLKSLHDYNGDEFEGLSKFCSCTNGCMTKTEQLVSGGVPDGLKTSAMSKLSIETRFLIIILSVAGGIVFFIILALALKYLKKRRKFRGP